jgi:hypothetical protein
MINRCAWRDEQDWQFTRWAKNALFCIDDLRCSTRVSGRKLRQHDRNRFQNPSGRISPWSLKKANETDADTWSDLWFFGINRACETGYFTSLVKRDCSCRSSGNGQISLKSFERIRNWSHFRCETLNTHAPIPYLEKHLLFRKPMDFDPPGYGHGFPRLHQTSTWFIQTQAKYPKFAPDRARAH